MKYLKKIKPVSFVLFIFIWPALQWLSCSPSRTNDIQTTILTDQNNFFYIDVKNYPQYNPALPIGIFDSGTGGLTVMDAIVKFDQFENNSNDYLDTGDGIPDFSGEYFIYLGDQANMPYGNYGLENNTELLLEHIIKDVQFLLGNKYYQSAESEKYETDKYPVKSIVIACNTATAFGKDVIESFLQKAGLDIRVIGVIGAGVRGAFCNVQPDEDFSLGVMATAGTVSSNGYVNTVNDHIQSSEFSGNVLVYQQAGIGLAGAIDGSPEFISPDATKPYMEYKGPSFKHTTAVIDSAILNRYAFNWDDNQMLFAGTLLEPHNVQINSVSNYINYHVTSLLEQLRKADSKSPLKVIILGCTHYPFYTDQIQSELHRLYNYSENGVTIYQSYMSKNIILVDPAVNTAKELYEFLKDSRMLNNIEIARSEFYISVPNLSNSDVKLDAGGNFTYDYKYGREAGNIQEYVKRVPFSRVSLGEETIQRLQTGIPVVYQLIQIFNQSNPKAGFLPTAERL